MPVDDSSRVAVEDLSFKILSLPAVPSFSLNFWSNTGKKTNYKRQVKKIKKPDFRGPQVSQLLLNYLHFVCMLSYFRLNFR